jgi:hypothetical protein
MGSSTGSSKSGAMKGSSLPQVGMADTKKNNASKGNSGSATTNYSNMKK